MLEHGLAGMSLRPLAQADRQQPAGAAVPVRLQGRPGPRAAGAGARRRARRLHPGHRRRPRGRTARCGSGCPPPSTGRLLALWLEAYARSLVEPHGPWAGFARQTVEDWLDVLARASIRRRRPGPVTERTRVLALLRGAMLDLLATGEEARVTRAVSLDLADRSVRSRPC